MVETRNSKPGTMAPFRKRDTMKGISSKLASSRQGADAKQILNLFLVLVTSSFQSNQKSVATLKENIGVLESSYKDYFTALEARVASLEEKIKDY